MKTARSTWLSLGALALAACTPTPSEPGPVPEFNAADPSLTCEAGKVGWDFSTGGNTDAVRVLDRSSEIRIIEATLGEACGASPGNRTESFARSCNGLVRCERDVLVGTEVHPTPQCVGAQLRVRYQCGVEDTVYESETPAIAGFESVRVTCGARITVLSASIGTNCVIPGGARGGGDARAGAEGNATAGLVNACNGKRRCDLPQGLPTPPGAAFEESVCARAQVQPLVELRYQCGSDPTVQTHRVQGARARLAFECPAFPERTLPLVEVRSARFGGTDVTARFRAACNGRTSCSRPLFLPGEADPFPGQSRDFRLEHGCGSAGPQEPVTFTAQGNQTVSVRCGQPITVRSASIGKACNPTRSAAVDVMRRFSRCEGQGRCVFDAQFPNDDWLRACPADQTGWEVTYTCGASSEERVLRAPRQRELELTCPAFPQPSLAVSGIRVLEASHGANCSERARNNLYANATACIGQSSCSVSTSLPAGVPVCRTGEVLIRYRCGEDEQERTITGLPSALGASVRLSCEPAITIASASFGGCSTSTGNATSALGAQCNGRLGACSFSVSALGLPAPATSCAKTFTASWRCGPDPQLQTMTLEADATSKMGSITCAAPSTPYVRKSCVPQTCRGQTRRDENLECVPDLTKPTLPRPSRWALLSSTAGERPFLQNWPTSLTFSAEFDQALPTTLPFDVELGQLTVYAVDLFRTQAGDQVEGFRCVVANPGFRRPRQTATVEGASAAAISAGRAITAEMRDFVLPESCFGVNVPSWRDALRRYQASTQTTISEADFRSAFSARQTELRVALDPQGRFVMPRAASETAATALVPNPIGFFYTPAATWVDFLRFYEQARLEMPARQPDSSRSDLARRPLVGFEPSRRLLVEAQKATLRQAEVEVDVYDATRLPTLEVDFDWAMLGDSPGRNPYSPTRVLTSQVSNTTQLNLGATVEVQARDVADSAGDVGWADAMLVGRVQGTVLGAGQPTGTTTRVMAKFTDALRTRLVTVKTASNNGWMASTNEAMREFRVRVCVDMDGASRFAGLELPGSGASVRRGDETFSVSLGEPRRNERPGFKRCVVANEVLVVKRSLEEKLLPHDHTSADTEVGNSIDQGNPNVNNETDSGNVGTCLRRCTVSADCGSGQTCRAGVCEGGSSTRCTSQTSNSSGGSGVFGASLVRTTSRSTLEDGMAMGGSGRSESTAELLGFQVLQRDEASQWTTPSAQGQFTISPNWSLLVDIAREGLRNAARASLLEPIVKPKVAERDGLSVGVGRTFNIFIGPLPIMAEVSATAGFSLALQFSFDLRSDYPCIGSSTCYQLRTERRTFAEANTLCQEAGGQLAELSTAAALAGTRAAIPDTTLEYWVGGQQSVRWPEPSCATNRSSPTCINQSTTRYRWVKSNTPFAEQRATSATLLNAASFASAFGGTAAQLGALSPRVPNLGGIAMRKGASAANDALLARNPTETRPFVCEFAPAARARASAWSAGVVLGAAAGVSFSACVPHTNLGICLSAGLNLIDAELSFAFERTNMRLWNAQGLLLGQEGTDAFKITAGIGFLTGAISVEVRLLFFSLSYDLVRFDGVKRFDWELYKHEYPTSQQ